MTIDRDEQARLATLVAARRDRQAFARLFDHFAPRIAAYLQRLGLARDRADEITQDVMVVLWHKAALFDPAKSSLATWLFRVARNRRIDAARRDRSHLLDPDDPIFQPEPEQSPDDAMDARTREERVREAMSALPEEQLELVRLAFFIGLSHSQIAERCGLPLGTVKSRIRLAFTRLRRALEEDPQMDTQSQ